MSRRKARECALTALYQLDISQDEHVRVLQESGSSLTESDVHFYNQLAVGTQEKARIIDPVIQKYLKKGWTLDRLAIIDRVILRIAVYELIYGSEPSGVILNEAVDIAKTYSSMESSRFINGVLGSMLEHVGEMKDKNHDESN